MAPSASGAGFAQFFPAAPRAAREKATERERAKSRASDATDRDAKMPVSSTSISSSLHRDGIKSDPPSSDAAHLPTDDTESLQGDTLNGVGSASSHASTASSVFSASNPPTALNASSHPANSSLTPLTNAGSPSYPSNSQQPKHVAKSNGPTAIPTTDSPSTSRRAGVADRIPARDPTRRIQGMKCTYDPLLDKKSSSSEKKTMKPTYKTFGSVRKLYYNISVSVGGRHLT
jgi:histone-lysine N-methyltransferase SETD1